MSNFPKCIVKTLRYIKQDSKGENIDEIEESLRNAIKLRKSMLGKMTQSCQRGCNYVVRS